MKCPGCGYSHTLEQDELCKELYYCTFCHLWYFIVPLASTLPPNPDLVRLRKRMAEKDVEDKKTRMNE